MNLRVFSYEIKKVGCDKSRSVVDIPNTLHFLNVNDKQTFVIISGAEVTNVWSYASIPCAFVALC